MQASTHLRVPMRIREEGREERTAPVLVMVSIEADAQSSTPRNLMCFQVSLHFFSFGKLGSLCRCNRQIVCFQVLHVSRVLRRFFLHNLTHADLTA